MEPKPLAAGDIMQINPDTPGQFRGCFFVVTKPNGWGATGYVVGTGGTQYPYRSHWAQMEPTGGKRVWLQSD